MRSQRNVRIIGAVFRFFSDLPFRQLRTRARVSPAHVPCSGAVCGRGAHLK